MLVGTSYYVQTYNTLESQLDFSITPKAFWFRYFDKVAKAPDSDNNANLMLISFYLKHGMPRYKTWSSKKIYVVKVIGPTETESFVNVRFKVVRGSRNLVFEFTLTDLPCLNLYNWISLFSLLSKDAHKFEPILENLKRMLVSYILEIAKKDVELAAVLRKKPIMQPKETPKDLDKMQKGKFLKDNWSMAYQQRDKASKNVQRCYFFFLTSTFIVLHAWNMFSVIRS